jgi:hypothetical protein
MRGFFSAEQLGKCDAADEYIGYEHRLIPCGPSSAAEHFR